MSATSKEITSTDIWYHVSSASGDSSSRWAKGAARKGVYNGQSALSLIVFDRAALEEALGSDGLQEATLTISRDPAYGTEAATVSLAPAYITSMSEDYMSRSDCIAMAMRKIHTNCVVEGETATFQIPGATLRAMWRREANAFLLYQEKDGADSYCKFGDSAKLILKVGTDIAKPVWTREISAGDVICGEINSHYGDLREIEYYIGLRKQYYGWQYFGVEMRMSGELSAWTSYITTLRALAETFLTEESRTYDWTPLPTGKTKWDSPNADVINNLRGVFANAQTGRYTAEGFTAYQGSASRSFNATQTMTWTQTGTVQAGTEKKQAQGSGGAATVYLKHVCGWIFDWENTSITNAAVELTVKKSSAAKPHMTLYAIKTSSVPSSANYGTVFDGTVIGDGYCTVGKACTIMINATGIAMLNNPASPRAYGVGIRYDSEYAELDKTAALVINQA